MDIEQLLSRAARVCAKSSFRSALTAAALLIPLGSSVPAFAQEAAKPAAALAPPPPLVVPPAEHFPQVGGHVGIALPVLQVSGKPLYVNPDGTTSNAASLDKLPTILNPIGVTVKLNKQFAVDFEMVVASNMSSSVVRTSSTTLVVDPGVIYNAGPVAVGLRLAFPLNPISAHVGFIPLVNKPIVSFGPVTWFGELALPMIFHDETMDFNIVLHTGVGF